MGPKRYFSADVKLDDITLSYVNDFLYLGLIVSVDYTDHTDVATQTRRQNVVCNMQIWKAFLAPKEANYSFVNHIPSFSLQCIVEIFLAIEY